MGKLSWQASFWGTLGAVTLIFTVPVRAFADTQAEQVLPNNGTSLAFLDKFKPELPHLDPASMLDYDSLGTRLVVSLGERRVYVYNDGEIKASFRIAVGRPGWETPKGDFKVLRMEKNPAWKNPWTGDVIAAGSDNPMGERAIDFWTDGRVYAAFHGTPNESVIGSAVSHGCLRMRNADIRTMYEMISVGTPVIVKQ